MRLLSHPLIPAAAAVVALVGLALPAAAGSFYRYETENGGIAYTDDAKRIPARYREDATPVARTSLDDFARFTPMAASEPVAYDERLAGRLAHLRDLNARTISPHVSQAPHPSQAGPAQPGLTVNSGQAVQTHLGPIPEAGPVIVETVRSRPPGSPVTRHITIVRQGERILSVTKPAQVHSTPRALDERTLELDH